MKKVNLEYISSDTVYVMMGNLLILFQVSCMPLLNPLSQSIHCSVSLSVRPSGTFCFYGVCWCLITSLSAPFFITTPTHSHATWEAVFSRVSGHIFISLKNLGFVLILQTAGFSFKGTTLRIRTLSSTSFGMTTKMSLAMAKSKRNWKDMHTSLLYHKKGNR